MPLEPYDWNVVVLGHWNPAILTPNGIAERLYQLPSGTEIGIEVPMDAIAPFRVSHEDLTVLVGGGRLMVEARENSFASLERAMRVAHRALVRLPETPVVAVGFNVRAQGSGEDGSLDPLIEATQLLWDDQFEHAGFPLSRRDVTWVADWPPGKISVNLSREDHDRVLRVNLNFERVGNLLELKDWLARPIGEVREHAHRIFAAVFALREEAVAWLR